MVVNSISFYAYRSYNQSGRNLGAAPPELEKLAIDMRREAIATGRSSTLIVGEKASGYANS